MNIKFIEICKRKLSLGLVVFISLFITATALAAFPEDLDDVVFIEEGLRPGITDFVRNMAVTGTMSVEIGGRDNFGGEMVNLFNSQRSVWPSILGCCNANAWLVVNVDGTWFAGTWEFMRVGQVTKSTLALVGPRHLRFPPLADFRPVNGEIYGFFNSCIVRNGITPNVSNCQERTEIALFQFGVGPVGFDAISTTSSPNSESNVPLAPILELLNE